MGFFSGFNAGDAGGILTGLAGTIGGAISQRKTNEMNYKIAQMNNEFNERMMEKQMAWNEEMWNKQNEYNTASNQRKRLEEAGFNPQLMMNGGSAGTATSANSVQAAQAANNPIMQAWDPSKQVLSLGDAFRNLSENIAMKKLRDSQSNMNNIQSEWYPQYMLSQLDYINRQSDLFKFEFDFKNQYRSEYALQTMYRTELLKSEFENNMALAGLRRLQAGYQEQLNQAFGAQFISDLFLKMSQMYLNGKLSEKAVADALFARANAGYVNLQGKNLKMFIETAAKHLYESMAAEAKANKQFYDAYNSLNVGVSQAGQLGSDANWKSMYNMYYSPDKAAQYKQAFDKAAAEYQQWAKKRDKWSLGAQYGMMLSSMIGAFGGASGFPAFVPGMGPIGFVK